jgi:hypothetical protein
MRNFAYLINPINAWEMKFSYIDGIKEMLGVG